MFLVGLTGGVASGKSEVGNLFASLGAHVLEADAIGHGLLERPDVKVALTLSFGQRILESSGHVSRRALGSVVFREHDALARLNAIVHPPLLSELKDALMDARSSGAGVFVLVAALLVDWGLHREVDRVVSVEASTAVRTRRLMRRLGISAEEAGDRVACQLDSRIRARNAHYVLDGDLSLNEVLDEARKVWTALQSDAQLGATFSVRGGNSYGVA